MSRDLHEHRILPRSKPAKRCRRFEIESSCARSIRPPLLSFSALFGEQELSHDLTKTGATHFRPERSEGASQPSGLSPALMTKQISDVGTRASCSWPNCKTIWRRRVSSQSELSLPNAPATKVKVPVELDKTVEFYEKLGFQFEAMDPGRATAYLNWWWFDFHEADAGDAPAWHVSPNVNNAEPRRAVLLQR